MINQLSHISHPAPLNLGPSMNVFLFIPRKQMIVSYNTKTSTTIAIDQQCVLYIAISINKTYGETTLFILHIHG